MQTRLPILLDSVCGKREFAFWTVDFQRFVHQRKGWQLKAAIKNLMRSEGKGRNRSTESIELQYGWRSCVPVGRSISTRLSFIVTRIFHEFNAVVGQEWRRCCCLVLIKLERCASSDVWSYVTKRPWLSLHYSAVNRPALVEARNGDIFLRKGVMPRASSARVSWPLSHGNIFGATLTSTGRYGRLYGC